MSELENVASSGWPTRVVLQTPSPLFSPPLSQGGGSGMQVPESVTSIDDSLLDEVTDEEAGQVPELDAGAAAGAAIMAQLNQTQGLLRNLRSSLGDLGNLVHDRSLEGGDGGQHDLGFVAGSGDGTGAVGGAAGGVTDGAVGGEVGGAVGRAPAPIQYNPTLGVGHLGELADLQAQQYPPRQRPMRLRETIATVLPEEVIARIPSIVDRVLQVSLVC